MLPFDSDNEGEQSFEEKATHNFSQEAIVPVTPHEVEAIAPTPAIGLGQYPEIPGYTFVREVNSDPVFPCYEVLRHEDDKPAVLHTFPLQQWVNIEERVCFRRTLEGMAKIRHVHLAEILDVAESDGLPFLVVEQAQGESLDTLTKGRPLPAKFVANLGELVARTLGVLHHAGTQHGNLTPNRIRLQNTRELVVRQGQVAFGEPKLEGLHLNALPRTQAPPEHDSQTGHEFCYAAPEAIATPPNVSPENDIYSLGVILYELLTGHPPHFANTFAEYQELVEKRTIIKPSDLVLGINETFDHIVMRCLEKSPQKRYQKGDDVADDLLRYLKNEPVSVNKSSLWQKPVTSPHRSRFVWGVCLGLVISFCALWWGKDVFFTDEKQPNPTNNEVAKLNNSSPSNLAQPEKKPTPAEPRNLPVEHESITKQLLEQLNNEANGCFTRGENETAAKCYQRRLKLIDSIAQEDKQNEFALDKAQTLLKLAMCYAKTRQYEKMESCAKKSLQAWNDLADTGTLQKCDPAILVSAIQSFTIVVPKDAETELFALSEKFEQAIRVSEPTPKQHQFLSVLLRMRAGYYLNRDIEHAEKSMRAVTLYANELLATSSDSEEAKSFHQLALMIDAQFRLRVGDLEKAEERFNQILAPANTKNTPVMVRIDALLGHAEIIYREKNPRNAETYLIAARTLGPCEKNVNQMYGRLVMHNLNIDNREQAREFAQKVLQSTERDRGLCISILRDFLRSFDFDSTKILAQQAIDLKVFEKTFLREFLEREPEYPIWCKNKDFTDWLKVE